MKYCSICKTKKGNFIKYNKSKYGIQYYHCRKCASKRAQEYRKTSNGKRIYDELRKRQTKKFPEKYKARYLVYGALKSGQLQKPKNCQHCKKNQRLDAHHPNYSKPLEIIWVCRNCHFDIYH